MSENNESDYDVQLKFTFQKTINVKGVSNEDKRYGGRKRIYRWQQSSLIGKDKKNKVEEW